MAEEQRPTAPQSRTVKINQIFLQGRIDRVTKYEDRFTHLAILPAPDAYSKPSIVEIESRTRLGSSGDDVAQLCIWAGWANNFKGRDGETIYGARGKFITVEQ